MGKQVLRQLLLGESPEMDKVREKVAAAIDSDAPVLLEGERGTGRKRVARAIHNASAQRGGLFVVSSTDDDDERGMDVEHDVSRACGGTLLVKDIARVDRPSQKRLAKLARPRGRAPGGGAAQGANEVRLVGATGIDLRRAVDDDLFDAELFERMGARIELPPLRRRPADVPQLAVHFARDAAGRLGRGKVELKQDALDRLVAYPWPGNVAELKDVIGRVLLHVRRGRVEVADVDRELPRFEEKVPLEQLSFEEMVRSKIRHLLERLGEYPVRDLYDEVIARVERPLLQVVLERTGGNQVRAAELLGLNRNTLRKKISERAVEVDKK
jgi:two-component system, NtrC family, nitrogen regulation response regulator GlnG